MRFAWQVWGIVQTACVQAPGIAKSWQGHGIRGFVHGCWRWAFRRTQCGSVFRACVGAIPNKELNRISMLNRNSIGFAFEYDLNKEEFDRMRDLI